MVFQMPMGGPQVPNGASEGSDDRPQGVFKVPLWELRTDWVAQRDPSSDGTEQKQAQRRPRRDRHRWSKWRWVCGRLWAGLISPLQGFTTWARSVASESQARIWKMAVVGELCVSPAGHSLPPWRNAPQSQFWEPPHGLGKADSPPCLGLET